MSIKVVNNVTIPKKVKARDLKPGVAYALVSDPTCLFVGTNKGLSSADFRVSALCLDGWAVYETDESDFFEVDLTIAVLPTKG
jgi:hypothetical protein